MYCRPSRAVACKLLGLWGAKQVGPSGDENSQAQAIKEPPDTEPPKRYKNLDPAITRSSELVVRLMVENGVPGLTICVSRGGENLWHSAFGWCDVENQVECDPEAKMRIASISKSVFSATVIGPMIESHKIGLEDSIYKYLTESEFPKPKFESKEHDITVAQLMSHTSGVRHYGDEEEELRPIGSEGSRKIFQSDQQFARTGFFTRKTYRNVIDALEPFKNEPLMVEPGNFRYTSYGFTLLSAVAQKALQREEKTKKEQIEDYWVKVLRSDWKLDNTSLDQDEPILSKRARYYMRLDKRGRLINAPYTDNSVKWAGGGLISTSSDLVKFGKSLIDAYKSRDGCKLKAETVRKLWTEVKNSYGHGFSLEKRNIGQDRVAIYHTGVACGASSVLLILPESEVTVAILANLYDTNLKNLAFQIADEFIKIDMTLKGVMS